MVMSNSEFLNWVADRFVNVHGESDIVDFVHRLRRLADIHMRLENFDEIFVGK